MSIPCVNHWRRALLWRHNELDGVSDHQPHDCLFNRLFSDRSKKTSKFRVTGLCAGNSPGTGEFPAQRASNAENVSIWWRHHGIRHFHEMATIVQMTFWNVFTSMKKTELRLERMSPKFVTKDSINQKH